MPVPLSRTVHVLLVEDNPADVRLVQLALERCGGRYELAVATDGAHALEHLRRIGREGGPARPDLVLLDLNLPLVGGREVLERIKADPVLRVIPVIVFSTSGYEDDVRFCYEHHAQSYIRKPMDLFEYQRVVCDIDAYWRGVATLPSPAPPTTSAEDLPPPSGTGLLQVSSEQNRSS